MTRARERQMKQWNTVVDQLWEADAEEPFLSTAAEQPRPSLAKTLATVVNVLKYSPDQPRDDHGRFGEGNGSDTSDALHEKFDAQRDAVFAAEDYMNAEFDKAREGVSANLDDINTTLDTTQAALRLVTDQMNARLDKEREQGLREPLSVEAERARATLVLWSEQTKVELERAGKTLAQWSKTMAVERGRAAQTLKLWADGVKVELSRAHAQMAQAFDRKEVDDLVSVLKYTPDQPRDGHGRFGEGSGEANDPQAALNAISAGKKATVSRDGLRGVLERAAKGEAHPDLTNLSVEGTAIYAGGLGYKREQMPQIPADHRDGYLESLDRQGIAVKNERVSPLSLLPTQNEIDANKVGKMLDKADDGKMPQAIFVSKDNYVLDGHHRWAMQTALQLDGRPKQTMPVIRVMADHKKALDTMFDYDTKHHIHGVALGKLVRLWRMK